MEKKVVAYTSHWDIDVLEAFKCTRKELIGSRCEYSKMQIISEGQGVEVKNEDPVFEIFRGVTTTITALSEDRKSVTFSFSQSVPLWVFREIHPNENDVPIFEE